MSGRMCPPDEYSGYSPRSWLRARLANALIDLIGGLKRVEVLATSLAHSVLTSLAGRAKLEAPSTAACTCLPVCVSPKRTSGRFEFRSGRRSPRRHSRRRERRGL